MTKDYKWITVPGSCHFKELKIEDGSAEEKNMNEELWFETREVEDAEMFVYCLRKWIVKNYPYKKRAVWLNDEWATSGLSHIKRFCFCGLRMKLKQMRLKCRDKMPLHCDL